MAAITFDAKTHAYRVDGKVYPSVTQICRYLQYDKASKGNPFLRDAAGAKGTAIHLYTQMIDNGLPFECPSDVLGYLQAYRTFLRDYSPQWLAIEQRVANTDLQVAGTIDRFGLLDGGYVIADIKSTRNLDKDYVSAQLHGYKTILLDEGTVVPLITDKTKPVKLLAIQLKPTGDYRIYKAHDMGARLFTQLWLVNEYREEINHAR